MKIECNPDIIYQDQDAEYQEDYVPRAADQDLFAQKDQVDNARGVRPCFAKIAGKEKSLLIAN